MTKTIAKPKARAAKVTAKKQYIQSQWHTRLKVDIPRAWQSYVFEPGQRRQIGDEAGQVPQADADYLLTKGIPPQAFCCNGTPQTVTMFFVKISE